MSPNSYKLVAALYILYHDKGFNPPTMPEISYFFSLRKSDKFYFFLVVHKNTTKKIFLKEESAIPRIGRSLSSTYGMFREQKLPSTWNQVRTRPYSFSFFFIYDSLTYYILKTLIATIQPKGNKVSYKARLQIVQRLYLIFLQGVLIWNFWLLRPTWEELVFYLLELGVFFLFTNLRMANP